MIPPIGDQSHTHVIFFRHDIACFVWIFASRLVIFNPIRPGYLNTLFRSETNLTAYFIVIQSMQYYLPDNVLSENFHLFSKLYCWDRGMSTKPSLFMSFSLKTPLACAFMFMPTFSLKTFQIGCLFQRDRQHYRTCSQIIFRLDLV